MLQSSCKLNLSGKDNSEEVPAVVLHVREESQTFEVCGRHRVCLIDKYEHLFSFINCLKKEFVEGLQQVDLSLLVALFAGKLADNFSQELDKGNIRVGNKRNLVFLLV
ncbi:MAG: hypothetical protein A4E63_00930 [Syntrophorhabdus sp. PtaU1.Bin050]|nr:MAG: hypothetical protein A4E63_00930 [Syntrophorhabdus sp. PtaU1.Bin050]